MAFVLGPILKKEWLACAALWLGGCASTCGDATDPGVIGELGNGRFLYTCGGTSDPACESSASGGPADYFPVCIARRGTFDLEYMLLDASALDSDFLTPVLYIESVNQGFFRGTDDFEALRVGKAAFVVRESERVLDLLHLTIVEPDDMDIVARDPATPTGAIEIGVGDTEVLRVFPRNIDCVELGGAVPIAADSSDQAIATVSAGDVLRIQGQAPGSAVVRVRLGALEKTIAVEVVGAPIDPDTGPDTGPGSDSEGSEATGTGSTGDTETGSTSGTTGTGSTSGSTGDTDGASTGGSSTTGGT